jgi:hypothetical protein
MPTFIIALAGVIALVLLILAWDLVTRPRKRRKIGARRAEQRAVEERPISGLSTVASQQGWQGPITEPTLTPGLPFGGTMPAGNLFAGQLPVDEVTFRAEAVSLAGYAGNLARHVHWVRDPDRHIRNLSSMISPDAGAVLGPTYGEGRPPRLLHCYRATVDGTELIVGNCYLVGSIGTATGYHGPIPEAVHFASAFCAASLPVAILGSVQVVPGTRTFKIGPIGAKSGYPELDEHYVVIGARVPKKSRSKFIRTMQVGLPDQPDPLGPELAAFIAQRDDWAFTLDGGLLVCATLEPLRSGDDARRLVADVERAVGLIGR